MCEQPCRRRRAGRCCRLCEVREVERCEEVLEEECSLVEEVVPECREVERQECRLKEKECSSVQREQCWLGPVGKEVSLIKWLLSTVQEK